MAIKTYPKGSTEKLAPNFYAYEFDCACSRCTETKVDEELPKILQKIWDYFGKPVRITGPYRCPAHNAEIPNAAKGSLHMKGMAADIQVDGIQPAEVAEFAESMGVLGIGLYDDFVHVDTRTYKSFWYGHAQEKRTTFGGAAAEPEHWYRIRKSWEDAKSQIAAYKNKDSAIYACPVGYSVFDWNGNAVYTKDAPTPQPTTYTLTLPVLRKGDNSSTVKALQHLLMANGIKLPKYGADGDFGGETEAGVIALQTALGIEANGVVGRDTMSKLLGGN